MYDVIVLGLGAIGSAAAFELARRGRKVLGLEQYTLGHDLGSSHGDTRIIRQAYFEGVGYVPIAQRAFERWYDLEQRCGRQLFTECGCLNLGLENGELIPGIRLAAQQHNLPVEHHDAASLQRRFPQFRFDDRYFGVFEPRAGFLRVEECVIAHNRVAAQLGAELHENEATVSWQANADGVVVETAKDEYRARRLIVTAGAWAGPMLADLGLPLVVKRKPLFWFETESPADFRRDRFPTYIAETPEGVYYGFPAIDSKGHKMARHDDGDIVADPARVDRVVTEADTADCRTFLKSHLPGAVGTLNASKVCLYTMTPDCHFAIDVHPRHPQVSFAAGFSGHGFKFASAIGEILADLSDEGQTPWPIEMFRIKRFVRS